jgi:iron complex outermembrane receptor protein
METWAISPKYIMEKLLWGYPNKLIFGLDFYHSDSDNSILESFLGSYRAEVKKKSIGLYALDEFSILESLILSLGIRNEWVAYDLFQEKPFLEDEIRDREPAWNAGLNYLFGARSSAFVRYNRSFRFPATDELVQFVFIPPNLTAQVNPDMKPQTGNHYEAGIRHAFTDQMEANLTFFWVDTKDEIFFNPQTFTNENFPKTRRQGIEVEARVSPIPGLSLWANYGYTRPLLQEEPYEGNDIPGVPRHKGSIGGNLHLGQGFLFDARINIIGSQYFISDWGNQIERLDGYYTVDAKLSYSWKGLTAFVGINNLFNREYSELGVIDASGIQYFYPSPERNYLGGVSYTF